MSSPMNRLGSLALAFMFLATLVPASDSQGIVSVSTDQKTAIEKSVGPGAPYGSWTYGIETATFYLHGTGGTSPTCTAVPSTQRMDLQLPQQATATSRCAPIKYRPTTGADPFDPISSFTGVTVTPPSYCITALNLTNIYSFESQVFIQGLHASNTVRARVFESDFGCKKVPTIYGADFIASFNLEPIQKGTGDLTGAQAGQVSIQPYKGTFSLPGTYGYQLQQGHGLIVEFMMGAPGSAQTPVVNVNPPGQTPFNIFFDSAKYNSYVKVRSDSARLNLWTENRINEVRDSFPVGDQGTIADRNVRFKATWSDTWGNREGEATTCTTGQGPPTANANSCQYDNLDENKALLRLRDITTSHTPGNGFCSPQPDGSIAYAAPSPNKLCYLHLVGLDQGWGINGYDPTAQDSYLSCCNSATTTRLLLYSATQDELAVGTGEFEYTYPYDADFPAGDYQWEMQDAVNGWTAVRAFHIGATGFTFQFAPQEFEVAANQTQASHLVGLNQRTDFVMQVTNHGADTDTFGFSVPTPGEGWTAAIQPSSLTLAPGGVGEVTLHITPSANAPAGKIKVISVRAVSLNDNSVKTLYTLTVMTAANTHGVFLASPKTSILTRPLVETSFPVYLRNLGTREDAFAIIPSGYPSGWQVTVTPLILDVFASSYQTALVTVRAPAEALAGTSFTLNLTGQDTQGLGEPATLRIPVTVYYIAGVALTTDTLVINTRDVAKDYATAANGDFIHDNRFDNGPLYRIMVENTGDREDTYQLTGSWIPSGDVAGCDQPANQYDGVPDGWRVRVLDDDVAPAPQILDPLGRLEIDPLVKNPTGPQRDTSGQNGGRIGSSAAGGYSGEFMVGSLTLPAHQVHYLWVDVYWVVPTGAAVANCPQGGPDFRGDPTAVSVPMAASSATFRLAYRSERDTTIRGYQTMQSVLTNRQPQRGPEPTVPGTIFGTKIEPAIRLDGTVATLQPLTHEVTLGEGYEYNLVVTNTGNSVDGMKVSLTSLANGWEHRFLDCTQHIIPSLYPNEPTDARGDAKRSAVKRGVDLSNPALGPQNCADKSRNCAINQSPGAADDHTVMRCENMGVYDSAIVTVSIRPPTQPNVNANPPYDKAKVGDIDVTTVTVSSDGGAVGNTQVKDDVRLVTQVAGDYAFRLLARPTALGGGAVNSETKDVYPGRSVAFPFTIQNLGTATDVYEIRDIESNKTWFPQLQAVSVVSVPSKTSYHGFLQVTGPTLDSIKNRLQHFRLQVRSLAPITASHPNTQVELLDFFANYVELDQQLDGCRIESQQVTIAPESEDRSQVTAKCSVGSFSKVAFAVDPLELPANWHFVCLPASHPRADPDCPRTATTPGPVDTAQAIADTRFLASGPGGSEATADFAIHVPGRELGQSRMLVRVKATFDPDTNPQVLYKDLVVNVASTYGLNMTIFDPGNAKPEVKVFTPSKVTALDAGIPIDIVHYTMRLTNSGLTNMTVDMTNTPPPCTDTTAKSCWRVRFRPESVALQAGETQDVEVDLEVPTDAPSGYKAVIEVCGTVHEDETQVVCRTLRPEVGAFGLTLSADDSDLKLAPQETAQFLLTVRNTGTVDDYVKLSATLAIPGIEAKIDWARTLTGTGGSGECDAPYDANTDKGNYYANSNKDGCEVFLAAGESRQVRLTVVLPPGQQTPAPSAGASASTIPVAILARSHLSTAELVQASATANIQVLDYQAADLDFDGLLEYAIDRDVNVAGANGYEEFRENLVPGGYPSKNVPLCRYLGTEAKAAKCAGNQTTYLLDADKDGRAEFFVSTNGADFPNVYWHPDAVCRPNFQNLTVRTDVTGDNVQELFLDLGDPTGPCQDGKLDVYYDLTTGKTGNLLQNYIDGDAIVDYVADLNGNQLVDKDEPVLFGGARGTIAKVQTLRDMDGNGQLDTVIDVVGGRNDLPSGDNPEYFIPAGNSTAIPICLQDVTGDGVPDWTYNSKGLDCHQEGVKADGYYDPVTKDAGYINSESVLAHNLKKYWYVGALFVLVLVLFLILVFVTRRR